MTQRRRGPRRKRRRERDEGSPMRKRRDCERDEGSPKKKRRDCERDEGSPKKKRRDCERDEGVPVKGLKLNLNELYERGKKLVWVVKIFEDDMLIKRKKNRNQTQDKYMTGFGVDESGLIITCCHGFWEMKSPKFEVRNIQSRLWYKAFPVEALHNCDVAILKLEGSDSIEAAKMGSGKVEALEKLLMIGNPEYYVGSGVVGRACYPCLKNPNFRFGFSGKCESHVCTASDVTPSHRIMGHVYNVDTLENARVSTEAERAMKRFKEQLLKDLPIIQLAGIVAGPGSSGSPIFNYKGEVVGMVHGATKYQSGIHVSVLKLFLERVQMSNLPTTRMHQGHLQLSKATAGAKCKNDSNCRSEGPSTS